MVRTMERRRRDRKEGGALIPCGAMNGVCFSPATSDPRRKDVPMSINENLGPSIKALSEGQMAHALQWMAEQIPGGFFVYQADERQELIYVNNTCIRLFGCESAEEFKQLTGNTFRGLVHPHDFERVQASIDEQIADPVNNNLDYVEYRIVRRDGTIHWVDDYGHLTQLPGYGDVYYVFIGDITDKHEAQEELHRRSKVYEGMNEQFNSLADESLTVFRTNITTGVIEEVRGRDLYDTDYPGGLISESARVRSESFLVPGDRERYDEIFRLERLVDRYYKGMGPAVFVGYCRRASGRQCFVKFSGSAAIDPVTGDVIAFGVETEYNTEKVTEVLNQRVLAQQYDMVSYIVGDHYGVVIGDARNIKRGNIFPKQRDGVYSEYIRDQVLPAASRDVRDPEQLRLALSAETVVKKLEESDTYTVDVTCEDGGELFFKRFTYYLVDRDAKFYLLLKSDITDVLREERERNLALADALRAAEQANAAKTSFLSNMSHEIRTPMNAIIGLDNIALQSPDLSPQTRDYLEKIGGSARHLPGLINDILDMSRIESGRLTLRKETFSFKGMLEQINTLVQAQCRDKGLSFECRIIGQVSDSYIGDDMKLKQVIINILSNAIKFTEAPGAVTLTIERIARFDGNSTLRFVISDTGIGMDEAFIPKIFDAFTQENISRSTTFGSTGLGMAITRSIVEMMNGTIAVSSKKGEGSEFTVTVTLRDSDEKGGLGGFINPREMSVLVVDDDPVACEHARIELEEVGIAADTCLSGAEALKLIELRHAKHEPYHLVLLDWKMPEQDGMEVARLIREHYSHETTIIILTAYNWDDIMEAATGAGVDGFMAKPLFASGVLGEYEAIMKRKGMALRERRRAKLAGKRVLMAEDVFINAEIMKQILAMRDMVVEHAENGRIALEMFENSPVGHYDAVLMDVRMPGMDGLEAASAICALDRPDARHVPIIVLTANAFDEDVQLSLQAGMTAHLSKPVEPDHLYETLEALIW